MLPGTLDQGHIGSMFGNTSKAIAKRVDALDWATIADDLGRDGVALTGRLLSGGASDALAASYTRDDIFRSRIVMSRHGFGSGEYKYFRYPLPDPVETLRQAVYPHLAPIANDWMAKLGLDHRYPPDLTGMLRRCNAAGQSRPTPLLLKYGPGDYNCLHQDLYGEQAFPIQLVILLSAPGEDFSGGEFVVTEQRPRMQSRAEVVPLEKGHGALFAVNERPKEGKRGYYRVKMRHGVSRLRVGQRITAGVIFHDAT